MTKIKIVRVNCELVLDDVDWRSDKIRSRWRVCEDVESLCLHLRRKHRDSFFCFIFTRRKAGAT